MDPDIFHPRGSEGRADNPNSPTWREPRVVCKRCPVAGDCLAYALAHEAEIGEWSRKGMWGGKTPAERYAIQHA